MAKPCDKAQPWRLSWQRAAFSKTSPPTGATRKEEGKERTRSSSSAFTCSGHSGWASHKTVAMATAEEVQHQGYLSQCLLGKRQGAHKDEYQWKCSCCEGSGKPHTNYYGGLLPRLKRRIYLPEYTAANIPLPTHSVDQQEVQKAAWSTRDRVAEAQKTAQSMQNRDIMAFMSEFNAVDMSCVVNSL
jgi:hypothetical protein